MTKTQVIKKLWSYTDKTTLTRTINDLTVGKPKNEALQLVKMIFNNSADMNNIWFTALAVVCLLDEKTASVVIGTSSVNSGHTISAMNKAELIDAITANSKLTKADAG